MAHAKKIEIHDRGQGQRPSGVASVQVENPPTVAPEKPVAVESETSPPPPPPVSVGKKLEKP